MSKYPQPAQPSGTPTAEDVKNPETKMKNSVDDERHYFDSAHDHYWGSHRGGLRRNMIRED